MTTVGVEEVELVADDTAFGASVTNSGVIRRLARGCAKGTSLKLTLG